jgi:chromosome segregation ATPase
MADEITRSLVQSRNYCTDRLAEVKAEIGKLQDEGVGLKATLETTIDQEAAGLIRRRRTFLNRRISELKAERERLVVERQTATDQLASLAPAAEADAASKAPKP